MTDTTKASNLPWRPGYEQNLIYDAGNIVVCETSDETTTDTIVRAVNAHDELVAERDWLLAEKTVLSVALAWYRDQARLCRLIHSEGDAGRNALAEDGGYRATMALAKARGDRR